VSRQNKVNPDHYTMAGRLTPDDLARERVRQGEQLEGGRRRRKKATPPWMANDTTGSGGSDDADDEMPNDNARSDMEGGAGDDKGEDLGAAEGEGAGMPRRRAAQKEGAAASRKGKRPAPRKKTTGAATGTARSKPSKAAGARGTPKTRKAPTARGSAARGSSPQRAGKPAARKAKTKGSGTTRQKQKGGPSVSKKAAPKHRKR
jgi:hypothetical protein